MTAFQWFTIAQTIVMTVAAAGVALLYRGFHTGKWVQDQEGWKKEVEAIHKRLDKAGQEMSNLTDDIVKLPDRFKGDFVSKEAYQIGQVFYQERHKELREVWEKGENALWIAIRDLQNRRRT